MTNIYNYHSETGELLRISKARLDPIEHKPLVPAFATLIKPPETKAHEAVVFVGGTWKVLVDYRETEYWLADGTHVTITKLGEVPPKDALFSPPVVAEEKTGFWKKLIQIGKKQTETSA